MTDVDSAAWKAAGQRSRGMFAADKDASRGLRSERSRLKILEPSKVTRTIESEESHGNQPGKR